MPTARCRSLSSRLHLGAQLEVERAERLVEQQHLRPVDERTCERDALLLAARQLLGPRLLAPPELDEADRLADPLAHLVARALRLAQPERDVS